MKYFVFNKPLDYQRGYMEHCQCQREQLLLEPGAKQGYFFSRTLDSREKGNIWHRMTMELQDPAGQVTVRLYSSDQDFLYLDGQAVPVETMLKSNLSATEKLQHLQPFFQLESTNQQDVLLHQVKGRYLWAVLILNAGYNSRAGAGNLFFYFPKETWMGYLPAIYQKDPASKEFLERYLGTFQASYDDLNRAIAGAASYLDPMSTPAEYLSWLAGWLDIANTFLWGEDRLRRLIVKAPELYSCRGTRRAIEQLVEIYTGEKPMLVEQWQVRPYLAESANQEAMERLYGSDDNVFVLLVKEKYVLQSHDREALLILMEEAVPAHMSVRLGILKPFLFLGDYSYLGINSGLGSYRKVQLDGKSMLPFAAIGGKEQGRKEP